MSNSTIKKTSLNFVFGLLGQVITMLVAILVPRMFIVSFGSEVNGFINSINQLFVYVALLEAGVGAASLRALYFPVGKNDKQQINRILSATHYYYKRTGWLYLLIIFAISFLYPLAVRSSLGYLNMVSIIIVTGAGGALPYFFQAKYKLLLQAEGKNYIISNIATINQILLSFGKVILLLIGCNVITVQAIYLILNIFQTVFYCIYIKKYYRWIDVNTLPNYNAIAQKNSVLLHQISGLIFNNTDVLILTFFCNLTTVSIYTMYKFIVSIITSFLSNISGSCSFKMGQIFTDRGRFIELNDIYERVLISLSFCLYSIVYVFIMPFLRLYTDGMDADYLLKYMPILVVSAEILSQLRVPTQNIITFAGHFKETQWRSLLESAINLTVSLICVNFFGIYGVMIGTVIALGYRTNDIIIYANTKILNRSPKKTYIIIVQNLVLSIFVVSILKNIVRLDCGTYVGLISQAGIATIFCLLLYIVINVLPDKKCRTKLMGLLDTIFNKKRGL